MAQNNVTYWMERKAQREQELEKRSEEAFDEVRRAYDQAGRNITQRIESIQRNAAKRGPDEQELYTYRMGFAKRAKAIAEAEFARLTETETRITEAHYRDIMQNAYNTSIFDIQQGTGFGFSFNSIPKDAIDKTVAEGWQGRDFKESVWRNTNIVANRVQEIIQGGFMSGASIDTMANQLFDMGQEINNELRKGKYAAYRLIRTEANYFANQGELESYKEAGITHYDYLATLDLRTSEECQGLDGKTFPVTSAVVGLNYPPMHPFCRSTTVAHFDDKNLDELKRRARDPVTGKTILVAASMDYEEWHDKYVKGTIETDDNARAERQKAAAIQTKMVKNRSLDKRQYNKYKKILGKNAPKTFVDFLELKYNNIGEWESLNRNVKLFNKIDNTDGYSAEYKEKLKDTYEYFRRNGYEFTEHGLNRVIGQKKSKNKREFSNEELTEILRRIPNYTEGDTKVVRYYNEIAVIQARDTKEIISVVTCPRPSKKWKEI